MHDQAPLTLTLACGKLRERQDIGATIAVHVCYGNVGGHPEREEPVGISPATSTACSEKQRERRRGGVIPTHLSVTSMPARANLAWLVNTNATPTLSATD
jgi:hypothetical protein